MEETFEDFLAALLAFESGWDRARYETGVIQDWQLTSWAGGPVGSFFPDYSSWSELSDAEWETMAYRSMNSLGFVGFQFGEALLIDLGYYDATVFYGNGASTNSWDGSWTGKNGVNSLEDFMTKAAQTTAIQEAFGYNLQVIETQLSASGQSLSDYIGQTASYAQNGETVTVDLTLTGILAAAHLRGAWGTASLLQSGAVSTDEYGTSILQYIDQFGGYGAPSVGELIAFYEDRLTGDEGLGTPGSGDPDGDTGGGTDGDTDGGAGEGTGDAPSTGVGNGTAGATAATATVAITWAWGTHRTVTGFDPKSDTIFIDWFGPEAIEVAETACDVVFTMASNNQTVTLEGLSLSDLSPANFTVMNADTAQEILSLVGSGPRDDSSEPKMIMITPDSASQMIDDFNPSTDMLHLEAGVTGELLDIADTPAGLTIRLLSGTGGGAEEIVLSGIEASDLSMNNFMVAEESARNEVAGLLGQAVVTPDNDGFDIVYDSDGSNPPVPTGTSDAGGVIWAADFGADDIIGFNPATDEIDFGDASVHGLILTMTPDGEPVIDNPWGPDMQILQGVRLSDLAVGSLGIVGNEHLRQDLGGILSWEKGIGPRDADTIYIRSHEYGVSEIIEDFDPATQKISFLYFGTRERLSVEDTPDGLVISSLPSGQNFTFTGVAKSDLIAGNLEFHHDQVMEDNLEAPFGMNQNDVALVSREALLTPEAPAGATTDGYQVREGAGADVDTGEVETEDTGGGSDDTGSDGSSGVETTDDIVLQSGPDTVQVTWDWGRVFAVRNFNPSEDILDFGSLSASDIEIKETGSDLLIAVRNNGGHGYLLEDLQAEDLTIASLTAAGWNAVVTGDGGIADQLQALGSGDMLM